MNNKKKMELDRYIEECTNYIDLNATKMAADCNVSPATISRYVKNLGYENFGHFRYSLVERKLFNENVKSKSDIISNKIADLNYSLSELKNFDFKKLSLIDKRKVLVYYEKQYEFLGSIFIEKMNLIHGNFVGIKTLSELKYLMEKNRDDCSILTIGKVPDMLYKKDYNYLEIKNQNSIVDNTRENVCQINLLNRSKGQKHNQLNSNLVAMNFALEIIGDEYTKLVLNKQQIDLIKNYLL